MDFKCRICGRSKIGHPRVSLCETCYKRLYYRKKNGIALDAPKNKCGNKFTISEQSKKIIQLLNSGNYTQSEVAAKFNISRQRVSEIKKKYT